ncbi:DUF1552 domain-containing protein [Aeoliella sp. ICT_H6.2]|uniref:DUF1552 domain-containing protein n=1 Tax=Aeoliella straminimaris TaxID=2954799 RepID=A0A9X2FAR2_9BACT|nr:DUF1552 domain-containing protein [Aeoliella straminimaris]MCO6045405.1 DUF1552 domain-containing protein [Aeoliella straminimaris]
MSGRSQNSRSLKLSRRTWLRGAGVACALPYLEAMGAALPAAKSAPKRLCYVYFPNGASLPPESNPAHSEWSWFPMGEGTDYQFTKVLQPLEGLRSNLSVLGGLSHPNSRQLLGHLAGDTWLTAGDLRGSAYNNQISADQVAARHLGRGTRYPSLVLSTDGGIGYKSRVATLSFGDGGRPIPAENRQREIFERYFSGGAGATTNERRQSLARKKKIVDLVMEDTASLQRQLGQHDRSRMDEYLTSLSSVEEQIQRNEQWLDVPLPEVDSGKIDFDCNPAVDPTAYLRTMFDLMVIAIQTDMTRVLTYMMAREDGMGFGENFPKLALNIKKGHHAISHDQADGHWSEWGSYDRWLAEQFAYFLTRLESLSDDHGSLLDNTLVLYGSACSTTHNAVNYPLVLAGGSAMGVRHGRYIKQHEETPMANLLVSMLNTVGVPTEQFGDSTGPFTTPGEPLFTVPG